jgi:hypothetical protein
MRPGHSGKALRMPKPFVYRGFATQQGSITPDHRRPEAQKRIMDPAAHDLFRFRSLRDWLVAYW